jgi:hypothetical protein
MRENRTYGSEGGEAKKPSLPLSSECRPLPFAKNVC